MSSTTCYIVLIIVYLASQLDLSAQDLHLRAGTLLRCTLEEPNFSSRSAQIGEPLTCHARPLREFGRTMIPHGAYLTGQFVSYRDPGRFVGKGWIKLEFDRLILPNTDVPIAAKLLSVGRFNVDAEGKILGRGHPKRDVIGWTIPLLWPVKLMTLPLRGPRPTLTGEVPVMLRLLEDVSIPREAYLSSANSPKTVGDESSKFQAQLSSSSLERRKETEMHSSSTPIAVPVRIQDRYQVPYRNQDRYRQP